MNFSHKHIQWLFGILGGITLLTACSKENPNHLPSVSPQDYQGKVEGFDSAAQIAPDHLIAYWGFEGTENEMISGTAPSTSSRVSYVDNGVVGKALSLDGGYLYYAKQLPGFDTSLKSFTVAEWVQIQNNGSTPTLTFNLAMPGQLWGNFDLLLETGQHPATDTSDLVVHPSYSDVNGGRQDNLNANWLSSYKSPSIPPGKWTFVAVTFDHASATLQLWANGVKIGAPDYQNRGTGYFNCATPNEIILGAWYNNIPGKEVTADTWTVPMVGKLDEIRVYNEALGDADIKALYELGAAGK